MIKSFAEMQVLAELANVRKRKLLEAGTTPADVGSKIRASSGGPDAKKSKSTTDKVVVEVLGDESRIVKKSCVDDINISFILWGNSQKVQMAGVRPQAFSLAFPAVGLYTFRPGSVDPQWCTAVAQTPVPRTVGGGGGGGTLETRPEAQTLRFCLLKQHVFESQPVVIRSEVRVSAVKSRRM